MAPHVQATASIRARRPLSMKLSHHDSRQRKVVGVAEISVFAQRLVHRCEDAEHGTPCTLVLQKYTSAMSTDVVWDRSNLQLGFTGCRPRAALVHVGCRSRCYGQSMCTMRSLSHVGLNHCPMYLSTMSLATCAKNTMHLSIVVFPTSCILWGLPPPMKHHGCSSGLGLLPSNHHIEPLY